MPKSETAVDFLIEQLHGPDWTARCDAARLLGQSGDPRAVDALLPDLNNSDWRVRRNAAQALGALRDKRATEALIGSVKDRTLTVRQRAIVALGRIKDPRALPALLDVMLEKKRESYDASKAIRKFGKKAIPELVTAYEQSPHLELLQLLADLKYSGVFELLVKSLPTREPGARPVMIRELAKLNDRRAIPYLMDELNRGDPLTQTEVVEALGKLGATEAIPVLLGMLKDDELYGPHAGIYRSITSAFQSFGGIAQEIQNAFPGNYPAMFNMGGAPFSLPEMMGMLGNKQSNVLRDAIAQFQNGFTVPENLRNPLADGIQKTMEDTAWKFGVMFEDAKDAKQEHVARLVELLHSESGLARAAAALSLAWYGDQHALDALEPLMHDLDETVRIAATWAYHALQKVISYRGQFGI